MIGNPDTKQQKTCKATFISNHQELSHEKEYFNGEGLTRNKRKVRCIKDHEKLVGAEGMGLRLLIAYPSNEFLRMSLKPSQLQHAKYYGETKGVVS